ncbi:MAG: DNA polymerase III subunit delta [Deltaproteobacteria bacterium]|nr:DNA polymerase III subunit delta [Deltaproteobacteria bacterium]
MAGRVPDRDVVAEVRAGRPEPVYYLYGKEQFLVQRALAAVRAAVLDPKTQAFNLDTVDCKEGAHHAERILAAARTLPMLARRRLVLVKDADELKPEDLEAMLPYLGNPAETTCLVFVAQNADLRRRFFLELRKGGGLAKFEPLYERRLPAWIEGEARALGHGVEPGAAQLLCDVSGADLASLSQALEQLSLFVGPRQRITVAAVEELCAETRQHSVFDLAKAVGERDTRRALHQCQRMLQAREPAVRILFMLTRHFRQLWIAQELAPQRLDREEAARRIGIPPFFVDGLMTQARRFDGRALARAFEALYGADRALKSSHAGDEVVLERLLVDLCRTPTGGGAEAGPRRG